MARVGTDAVKQRSQRLRRAFDHLQEPPHVADQHTGHTGSGVGFLRLADDHGQLLAGHAAHGLADVNDTVHDHSPWQQPAPERGWYLEGKHLNPSLFSVYRNTPGSGCCGRSGPGLFGCADRRIPDPKLSVLTESGRCRPPGSGALPNPFGGQAGYKAQQTAIRNVTKIQKQAA
nr:hypothetical protein [Leisingera aquaemixtae]